MLFSVLFLFVLVLFWVCRFMLFMVVKWFCSFRLCRIWNSCGKWLLIDMVMLMGCMFVGRLVFVVLFLVKLRVLRFFLVVFMVWCRLVII